MLILSRKIDQSIVINGDIVVKVLRLDGDTVKLGIEAPKEVAVNREEIHLALQATALKRRRMQSTSAKPVPGVIIPEVRGLAIVNRTHES
jgi:carbon storage regulator